MAICAENDRHMPDTCIETKNTHINQGLRNINNFKADVIWIFTIFCWFIVKTTNKYSFFYDIMICYKIKIQPVNVSYHIDVSKYVPYHKVCVLFHPYYIVKLWSSIETSSNPYNDMPPTPLPQSWFLRFFLICSIGGWLHIDITNHGSAVAEKIKIIFPIYCLAKNWSPIVTPPYPPGPWSK